jgi:hypothetical protein
VLSTTKLSAPNPGRDGRRRDTGPAQSSRYPQETERYPQKRFCGNKTDASRSHLLRAIGSLKSAPLDSPISETPVFPRRGFAREVSGRRIVPQLSSAILDRQINQSEAPHRAAYQRGIAEGCERWAISPNHVRPVPDWDASNASHEGMIPAKSIRATFWAGSRRCVSAATARAKCRSIQKQS